MARTIRDSKLDSRAARRRLMSDNKLHWRNIHAGLHLGYRKGKRGGRWLVRAWSGEEERYATATIGTADDDSDADGIKVLSWSQAQEAARERATDLVAKANGKQVGPYTVADAMADYHRRLESQGRVAHGSRRRTELYILPALGKIRLDKITADKLRQWLADTANHPGYNRRGEARCWPASGSPEQDAENKRRRRDSANRVLAVLKAGLNEAFNEGKCQSNAAWASGRLRGFAKASKARGKYLSTPEVKRLVDAAQPGFCELVLGALHTGARYGDLTRMDVGDFNAERGLVMCGNSKGVKPHPVYLTDPGTLFFKRQTANRDAGEPMFRHPETGQRWQKSQQIRPMKKAAEAASLDITFHGLRTTYASHAVMNGVPLNVVAPNLGHSSTRMVERHYGHLADSYVRDTVRRACPDWGIASDDDFVPF